jgi:chromate transport protein ChrA
MLKPPFESLMGESDGPSSHRPKPGRVVTFIALPLAGLLWFGMVSFLSSYRTAGELLNGIEAIAAILCGFALWLMLAGMLALTAADGRFTRWTDLAAPAVFGLSLLGAYRALLLSDNDGHWWLALVAVLPLLVALHAWQPHLWILAAMVLLCVPTVVLTPTDKVPKSERGERIAGAVQARAARDRAEYKASPQQVEAFSRFGPDSRMDAYLPYYFWGDLAGRARGAFAR